VLSGKAIRDDLVNFAGRIHFGCAGWSLPRSEWPQFPRSGTHLQRYAARFDAVEINSSFYRPHRRQTYARWAASVSDDFRFAVKLPKTITHTLRLRGVEDEIAAFLEQATGLGNKLGCLLVQLPPSLKFERAVAENFFRQLRARHGGDIACEPRHASWFRPQVDELQERHRIARVAVDPTRVPAAAEPGGFRQMVYYRWHGAPRMYYSKYEEHALATLAERLRASAAAGARTWCVFDNTALGAAIDDARRLQAMLGTAAQ